MLLTFRPIKAKPENWKAADLLAGATGWRFSAVTLLDHAEAVQDAFRVAARTAHPDKGGDPEVFASLTAARDLLLAR